MFMKAFIKLGSLCAYKLSNSSFKPTHLVFDPKTLLITSMSHVVRKITWDNWEIYHIGEICGKVDKPREWGHLFL